MNFIALTSLNFEVSILVNINNIDYVHSNGKGAVIFFSSGNNVEVDESIVTVLAMIENVKK